MSVKFVTLSLLSADIELFHTPGGEPYATLDVHGRCQICPLDSKEFRDLMERRYYELSGTMPSKSKIQEILRVMEGQARFDGPELPVRFSVEAQNDAISADLTNSQREEVSEPLPIPEKNGNHERVIPFRKESRDEPLPPNSSTGQHDWAPVTRLIDRFLATCMDHLEDDFPDQAA